MLAATISPLTSWISFYTIIGAAAATLMGLMFVVITLSIGTARRRGQSSGGTIGAFGTPNVVHFGTALLIAATFSAPWPELWNIGFLLGLSGLGGMVYITIVVRRTRHQTTYQPVLEDWLWHSILPFVCYTVLVVAALLLTVNPVLALFGIGAVTVLLLFIGIHNAWDTVTYLAVDPSQSMDKSQDQ